MAAVLFIAIGFASIGISCQGVETKASESFQLHSIKPFSQPVRMSIPINAPHTETIVDKEEDLTTEINVKSEEDITQEPAEAETIENKEVMEQSVETVTIGDYTYHKIDDEKFTSHIEVAGKYGAKLYGIPESDGFMIYHDLDGILLSMSTGVAVTELAHMDVLVDYFSTEYWAQYPGIVEGINQVVETGEEVRVDLGDNNGYVIKLDDGNLVVLW